MLYNSNFSIDELVLTQILVKRLSFAGRFLKKQDIEQQSVKNTGNATTAKINISGVPETFSEMTMTKNMPLILLLLILLSSCNYFQNEQDKYPEVKHFPEFTSTSKGVQLKQLSTDNEDISRVYISRDKKHLIVIANVKEDQKSTNTYRFLVYDNQLNLIKKIDAADLNGLFGLDDIGDIYAGKGYFDYSSYLYKPIREIWATDQPAQMDSAVKNGSRPMIFNLAALDEMIKRGDTLLSFTRKDYLGTYYYLKKSGAVYNILFKKCAYCESRFNKKWSISEYSAEEDGNKFTMRPYDQVTGGFRQSESIFYYTLQAGNSKVDFKVRYSEKNTPNLLKKMDFSGQQLIIYQPDTHNNSKLYLFKTE